MVALVVTTPSLPRRLLAVFVGGFFGTVTRYLLSIAIQSALGKAWPYDILLINVTGACVLAFITTLADASLFVGPTRRLFLNVGFLGAYTTFSSLALGDVLLFANGRWPLALLYLLLSLAGGIGAVLLGDALGQWCIRQAKRRHVRSVSNAQREDHLDMQDDLLLPD